MHFSFNRFHFLFPLLLSLFLFFIPLPSNTFPLYSIHPHANPTYSRYQPPKMTLPPRPRPKVLIVGAGLGGLMLGILLDKIGVPYHIFERALEVKPLGTISFSFGLVPYMTPSRNTLSFCSLVTNSCCCFFCFLSILFLL